MTYIDSSRILNSTNTTTNQKADNMKNAITKENIKDLNNKDVFTANHVRNSFYQLSDGIANINNALADAVKVNSAFSEEKELYAKIQELINQSNLGKLV